MSNVDPKLLQEVLDRARAGRKIDAIKMLREATGMGLAEAKAVVEEQSSRTAAHHQAATRGAPSAAGMGLPAKVQGLLRQGREIDAIKTLRQARGLDLKDAHDEVQAYLDRHPDLRRLNPNYRSGAVVVIVLIAAGLVAWLLLR